MRGADTFTEGLFTLKKLDDFVPANHPLRVIRTMVNKAPRVRHQNADFAFLVKPLPCESTTYAHFCGSFVVATA